LANNQTILNKRFRRKTRHSKDRKAKKNAGEFTILRAVLWAKLDLLDWLGCYGTAEAQDTRLENSPGL